MQDLGGGARGVDQGVIEKKLQAYGRSSGRETDVSGRSFSKKKPRGSVVRRF